MTEKSAPLVSISCVTYNHSPFLRQCLDGFFMQQCNFDFEILLHDDASIDGSQDIIKGYMKRHPGIIKPIFQTENQYSKGVRSMSMTFNAPRARGKYIALCESDDYWTDPLKLQKQVDFLEKNPEYSLTVGGYLETSDNTEEKLIIREFWDQPNYSEKGFDITLDLFKRQWITKTLTLVFRRSAIDLSELNKYKLLRDVHLNYHLLKNGQGYYFKEVFGVYRIHEGGVHSLIGETNQHLTYYTVYKELFKFNHFDFKNKFYRVCSNYIAYIRNHKTHALNSSMSKILKDGIRAANTEHEIYDIYSIAGVTNKVRIKVSVWIFKIKKKLNIR